MASIRTNNNRSTVIFKRYSYQFQCSLPVWIRNYFFTLIVKVFTFPLNQKQIKSSKAMQDLQPRLKEMQKKYADDKEKLMQVQMELYKEAGVNPLGGCLPMIVQMPVWFALYRALFELTNPAHENYFKESFFWIPDLSGPVSSPTDGLGWLLPTSEAFLGFPDAIYYLILPVLLVVVQFFMQKMLMPKSDDPQQQMMSQMMMFMPLMFGYFALVVPSGLTLYWFTNTILSVVQQYYLLRDKEAVEQIKTLQIDESNLTINPALAMEGGIKEEIQGEKHGKSRSTRKRKRKKHRKNR